MAIKVDKNVPLPPIYRARERKYPLDTMEVGDSFFVEDGNMQSVRGSVGQYERKTGKKFTARSLPTGVRVWRTE